MKFLVILMLMAPIIGRAENLLITAKIFEEGKTEGKPLFEQETRVEDQKDGTTKSTSFIKDPAGTVVMTETALLKGDQILSQQMEQRQTGEAYELERKGKEIIFRSFQLVDGAKKPNGEKTQEAAPSFITGPSTGPFLRTHWEELRAGKSVAADFGVFEIERSVSFEFSWQSTKEDFAVIKMKPSSTFISMIVSPIFMYLGQDGKRMMRFKGRTPLKKIVMGNKKPFDAEILYEYQPLK